MSDHNGNGHIAPKDRLRAVSRRLRDLDREAKAKRLERKAQLLESCGDYGAGSWWSGFYGWLDRTSGYCGGFGPLGLATISTTYDRRFGRDFPMFQTEVDLAALRMPGRIMCSTNDYAMGLVGGLRAHVIGEGYTYHVVPKDKGGDKDLALALQAVVDDFLERNHFDGGPAGPLQSELFWRWCEDGEFFLNHFVDDEGRTNVRTAEPEQVTMNGSPWRWQEGSFGILTDDEDTQNPLAYWIFYGDSPSDGHDYAAERILHLKKNVKASIKRGFTDFSFDTLSSLQNASQLIRALGVGSTVKAGIVGIRSHETASSAQATEYAQSTSVDAAPGWLGYGNGTTRYEPGTMLDIDKGQTWQGYPNDGAAEAHIAVLHSCCHSAGRRWNAPSWLTTGAQEDMAAYTAALAANSPFVQTVKEAQAQFKWGFRRSVKYALKAYLRFHGGITVRKRFDDGTIGEHHFREDEVWRYVELKVEAPDVVTSDPLAAAQVNQIELQNKTTSPQQVIAEKGGDYEQVMAEWDDFNERTGGGGQGLPMPGQGGGGPAGPGAGGTPAAPTAGGAQSPPAPAGGGAPGKPDQQIDPELLKAVLGESEEPVPSPESLRWFNVPGDVAKLLE